MESCDAMRSVEATGSYGRRAVLGARTPLSNSHATGTTGKERNASIIVMTSSSETCSRNARDKMGAPRFPEPIDGNTLIASIVSLTNRYSEGRSALSRPRVLLADDYPDMVKAVSRLLALDCEIVGSVADGNALLQTAQRLQPDVIVLDVNLPNVDTLKACREITRVIPHTKVIMFTAMDASVVSQAFIEAGASAFVSKLASVDLLVTIQRLCVDEASA